MAKRFDEDMIVAGQHAFLMLLERIEALPQLHQVRIRHYFQPKLIDIGVYICIVIAEQMPMLKLTGKLLIQMYSYIFYRYIYSNYSP